MPTQRDKPTLQKSITRTPFFIKNRMRFEASDKDDRFPNDGALALIRGGSHKRYSLSPDGAPSFETTSSSLTSSAKSFPMYSAGFASVALHEMKRSRLSGWIGLFDKPSEGERQDELPTAAHTLRNLRKI